MAGEPDEDDGPYPLIERCSLMAIQRGSRICQIAIQKNPRLIGLKRPTWSVEPGIGTTINAGVQSACGRQRSTAGEVVAPLVRLPVRAGAGV